MRFIILVVVATACSDKQTAVPPSPVASSMTRANHTPLAVQLVTLLQPEAVVAKRLGGGGTAVNAIGATIQSAADAVIAYDAAHAGVLPAEFDLVLAARTDGMRVWLVGSYGDLAVRDLADAFARLPKMPVLERNVGVVVTLARSGTQPVKRSPYAPGSWKAAAGKEGSPIDDVIDAAWSR